MTNAMTRNSMMSYTASANNAEAAFACENMSASAIIMGAAIAALFFVVLSVLVGALVSVLIGLVIISLVHLIITRNENSPKKMKQRI